MAIEVIMPALGISQDTGRIIAWLKNEGDVVKQGDAILEIETDKTTVEIEASAGGILTNVTAHADEDVPVGTVIAFILPPGETQPVQAAKTATAVPTIMPSSGMNPVPEKHVTPVAARVAQAHGIDVRQIPSREKQVRKSDVEAYINRKPTRVLASPKARRLADELGIDIAQIQGSGLDHVVLADDVMQAASVREITPPVPNSLQAQAQTGQMWRRMAERLSDSWRTIPHFFLKREIRAESLIHWRQQLAARSEVKVTYTDLLVKLTAAALKEHPHVNGSWTDDGVTFNSHINIGLAVAVEEGLLVPVIHDADQLGVTGLAQRRQELMERSQRGKLKAGDLDGGTFTISNLGMYDIDEFSAIVNPPQAAILAVGRISEQVVPVNGQPLICPMMTLTLSCDHRAVDGVRAAQFLKTLAQVIEDPLRLMD